jgi:23S rRNA (cytosine1962-C5)-methyltransferase
VTDVADFANRVRKNARHLGRWARRRGIECYRVYDRDIPEFAFALDVYGEHAHLQEYDRSSAAEPSHAERQEAVRRAAADALGIAAEHIVLKRRARRRAGAQHEKTGASGDELVVRESGHRFIVNL